MNQCDIWKIWSVRIKAFCLTRLWTIRFKWMPRPPLYIIISLSSSSLSSSPLSSAVPDAGRCVGGAGRVWRTGRQRPPTSSQPCPSGEGWCFVDGLDTPSSWRGGSVGVGCLQLEGDELIMCPSFSLGTQPWCYFRCRRRWHVVWTWRAVLPAVISQQLSGMLFASR